MSTNAESTPEFPYEVIRYAIRENFPSLLEPSRTLGDALNSIRTKVNRLSDIVNAPASEESNQEMTDTVNGLLEETVQVIEEFKVWHEKLNVACVMIKLVYPQQETASATQ